MLHFSYLHALSEQDFFKVEELDEMHTSTYNLKHKAGHRKVLEELKNLATCRLVC